MIEVNNLSNRRISKKFLQEVAEKTLGREKETSLELSIAVVDKKRIRELNRRYRKKDKATDVLSFTYGDFGEIVLCPEIIETNARQYKFSFKKELTRVLIHGILHILGYNHQEMEKKQNNG